MNLQEAAAEMGSSSSSRSGLHGVAIDESKKAREFDDQKDQDCSQDNDVSNKVGPDGGNDEKNNFQYPYTSVKQKDTMQDEQLQYTRAKMGEVREENQRLKVYLDRIMKDYQTLQMHFCAIVQQEVKETRGSHQQAEKPDHQLVSLSLGRMPSSSSADSKHKIPTTKKEADHQQDIIGEGLSLGMDPKCLSSPRGLIRQPLRNRSPAGNSSGGELNGVAAGAENWPPTKNLKTMRAGDDEASQQSYLNKKPRVSVRARCDAPTLNDGCQWRKYGQKIAKGNPCPRAYYRCTVAPSCPVRKQVQRCAEDMSILITTYEGTHNHPLPMAATAMASTTSAAACMLMSGSSSSTSQPGGDATGLNFYVSSDPTSSRLKQLHIANPSISSSSSHPTITLDLTSSSSSHNFSNPISSSNLSYPPRFNIINNSSTSQLNFNSPSEANANQISWLGQPFSKRPRMTQDNYLYHSFSQRIGNTSNNPPPQQQSMLPEPLAAATKVITSDPGFQSALVAALTSLMGNGGENFGQKPKWEASSDYFPDANASTYESTSNSRMPLVGAGSSGGLMFFPRSSLPFASTNKSSDRSASPPNPKNSTS